LVLDGGLRAALEEELDDLGVSLARGDVQRRAAVGVAEVGVGAAVEELADPLHAALRHGTAAMVSRPQQACQGAPPRFAESPRPLLPLTKTF